MDSSSEMSVPEAILSIRPPMLVAVWLVTIGAAAASGQTISWSAALDQEPAWYGSPEAERIAANVLLHQHENGGWPKNVELARPLDEGERRRIREARAEPGNTLNQTTIDNDATHTELRFLARVHDAAGGDELRRAFVRGVEYLLAAQYENGGWPQYFPIREGYYEHITFNDDAMIGVMRLLRDVAEGRAPHALVDASLRSRAEVAVRKGVEMILAAHVEVGGRPTAWCAQHDRHDLRPREGRSYELPSLSGAESVEIVRFLMELEDPGPEVVRAVEGAVEWLDRVKLTGIRVQRREDPSLPRGFDRVVVADPSAPSLWARFYEIGTDRPMFVGRDRVVRDRLSEIEHERRIGYRYLGDWPTELLADEYPRWRARWVDAS
jgi:PelA/Pel-15E family pectate lyase